MYVIVSLIGRGPHPSHRLQTVPLFQLNLSSEQKKLATENEIEVMREKWTLFPARLIGPVFMQHRFCIFAP